MDCKSDCMARFRAVALDSSARGMDVTASGTRTVADTGIPNANLTRALPMPLSARGRSVIGCGALSASIQRARRR